MEPVRRAATRARRLQLVLASEFSPPDQLPFLHRPFSLRQPMLNSNGHKLRSAIDDSVVAFLSPTLPLTTSDIKCTDVLVEIRRGTWTLNARLEALVPSPVPFVIGFAFAEHMFFGFLFGAVNFSGGPPQITSPTSSATLSVFDGSMWLRNNFETATREGVIFRLVTGGMDGSPRALVRDWRAAFPKPMHRPLSLLDDQKSDDMAWGVNPAEATVLDEPQADDGGLSFEVSLRFE